MQQFNWIDMADIKLVTSLCDALELDIASCSEEIRKLLGRLFEIAGGFPLLNSALTEEAYQLISRGLLDDALREAFAKDLVPPLSRGTFLEDRTDSPFKFQIMIGDLVFINWCTEKELSDLPGLGPGLAQRIIGERRRNGAFKGGLDLSKRVPGIGEHRTKKILRRLRFNQSPCTASSPPEVMELVKFLVAKTGMPPYEGLRRILEYALTELAVKQRTRWYADQYYDYTPPIIQQECSWIGILRDSQYYYWLSDAFDRVEENIEMAMFHMAMPADNHPTRLLLNKLIAAKNRGVKVRVLLDRDRKGDIFNSTVININALKTLKANGIDARFDTEDKLLHSKFLVLDSRIAIVGSHNWSAGSYFNYDDMTMVIHSEPFAQELIQRFEKLWAVTEQG